MTNMASDDTFRIDDPVGEGSDREGDSAELSNDTHEEIRVTLRAREAAGQTELSGCISDGNVRELRVAHYDPAAARCGRWGDERWR